MVKKTIKKDYKYSCDKEVFSDIIFNLSKYFKPFFDSYRLCKKTFVLQCINLVLTVYLLSILLDGFTSFLITTSKNSSLEGTKIILVLLLMILTKAWKSNKVFDWHTIFDMKKEYTKKHLKRLIATNIFVYVAKNYIYERRN